MHAKERGLVYGALVVAVALGLRSGAMVDAPALAAQDERGSIAICSVGAIIDELMETDRYLPERRDFEQELRAERLDGIVERMEALEAQVDQLDPEGEEFAQAREEYFRLRGAAERLQLEIRRKVEAMVAEQLIEIRGQVVSSARAVAEDLGYTYVIASENDQSALEEESVRDLVIDMLSRPVLLAPQDADITEDVREDLNLD